MPGKRVPCLLPVLLCGALAFAQAPVDVRFASLFNNSQVAAYSLELPPHGRAVVFQGTHDVLWVALNDATVQFARRGRIDGAQLNTGDVRFFPAFQLMSISNDHAAVARGILVEIKARGQIPACECSGGAERAVCGCSDGGHLPPLWALGFGAITLGGTTLSAGQSFLGSSDRDDMLLIAVTDLDLKDEAAQQAAEQSVRLAAGQVRWVRAGAHQFRNPGTHTARFVSVEF